MGIVGRFLIRRIAAPVGVIAALALWLAPSAFAAQQEISSSGPLTDIWASDNLACQVLHAGQQNGDFFAGENAPASCGTVLSLVDQFGNSSVFGVDNSSFTPVSGPTLTGSGTTQDPYVMTTVVDAGTTGVRVTQKDTYVVGSESYRTDITFTNSNDGATYSGHVYHLGDCTLDGSDSGFGAVDTPNNGVACTLNANNNPSGPLMEFAAVTTGSHYFEGNYGSAFSPPSAQAGGADYPDMCECTTRDDNGMGIDWGFVSLGFSQQAAFSLVSTFSEPRTAPAQVGGSSAAVTSSTAALNGTAVPGGLATTGRWIFGLDASQRGPGFGGNVFDQSTPSQFVGSDYSSHTVPFQVSNLRPNSVYRAKFVATNSAGTTTGPDVVFTTLKVPVPNPVLGRENFTPIGTVFILVNGQFVKLTQTLQLPSGTVVDALKGSVVLVGAGGGSGKASDAKANKGKKVGKSTGTFGGAVFKVTQAKSGRNKGLTTISLVEGGIKGIPTYASCKAKGAADGHIALSRRVLQTLRSRGSGRYRTRGRYAAGTVRGTKWTTTDRCDGTLIAVQQRSVLVTDLVKHKTILVRAGHFYLAKAPKGRKR